MLTCFRATASATCSAPQELAEDRGGSLHRGALGKRCPTDSRSGRSCARLRPATAVQPGGRGGADAHPDTAAGPGGKGRDQAVPRRCGDRGGEADQRRATGNLDGRRARRPRAPLPRPPASRVPPPRASRQVVGRTAPPDTGARPCGAGIAELDGAAKECPALPDHIGETSSTRRSCSRRKGERPWRARGRGKYQGALPRRRRSCCWRYCAAA